MSLGISGPGKNSRAIGSFPRMVLHNVSLFKSVTSSSLSGAAFQSFLDFVRFICAFPNLAHLLLSASGWKVDEEKFLSDTAFRLSGVTFAQSLHLRQLTILRDGPIIQYACLFTAPHFFDNLDALYLGGKETSKLVIPRDNFLGIVDRDFMFELPIFLDRSPPNHISRVVLELDQPFSPFSRCNTGKSTAAFFSLNTLDCIFTSDRFPFLKDVLIRLMLPGTKEMFVELCLSGHPPFRHLIMRGVLVWVEGLTESATGNTEADRSTPDSTQKARDEELT
ncbi:hypothetical protein OBBRIDRAFT_138836 [Obba rivulosa]|uniref:Uncharacterized protein n=1 Tax=Obba rivulosa TaxID=1052685 RepID=A0A8E2AT30_9APHY|nr:hypothetical protein OBBRIDRAFT_138836 [Obba rivulosa]